MGDNPFARGGKSPLYDDDGVAPSNAGLGGGGGAWGNGTRPAAAPPQHFDSSQAQGPPSSQPGMTEGQKRGAFMDRFRKRKEEPQPANEPGTRYAFDPKPPAGPQPGQEEANWDRQAALDQRERQLAERERRLAEREAALSSGAFAGGRREKNWPVCCKVVHHDIKGDVPARAQRAVTLVYWSFLLFAVCMAYNTLAATCALFTVGVGVLWQWMLSWIFIIGGVPGAAILWYLRLYNAATNDRFTTFIWFFLMYFIHLAFCIVAAAAPPFSSSTSWFFAGFVSGSKAFHSAKWLGTMYMVGGVFWIAEIILVIFAKGTVLRYWRNQGGPNDIERQVNAMNTLTAMNGGQGGRGGVQMAGGR